MKKNLYLIIVTLFLLISLVGNVYFFNINGNLSKSVVIGLSDLESVQNDLTAKTSELTEANAKISEFETSMSDLTTELDNLKSEYNSLIKVEEEVFEKMDVIMYVVNEDGAPVRRGTSDDYISDETLPYAQAVHVTGQSTTTKWYQLEKEDGTKVYVSHNYLSDTKPSSNTASKPATPAPAAPTQNDEFWQQNGFEWTGEIPAGTSSEDIGHSDATWGDGVILQ